MFDTTALDFCMKTRCNLILKLNNYTLPSVFHVISKSVKRSSWTLLLHCTPVDWERFWNLEGSYINSDWLIEHQAHWLTTGCFWKKIHQLFSELHMGHILLEKSTKYLNGHSNQDISFWCREQIHGTIQVPVLPGNVNVPSKLCARMRAQMSWDEHTQETWSVHKFSFRKYFLHIFHTIRSKYKWVLVKCCTQKILCRRYTRL